MDKLKKIKQMEVILNKSLVNSQELIKVLKDTQDLVDDLEKLFSYYDSSEWLEHLKVDEMGEIPQTFPRGVLSEDAIYNVLLEYQESVVMMQELAERFQQAFQSDK